MMVFRRHKSRGVFFALAIGIFASNTRAMFISPTPMPVARLIHNLSEYLTIHPKDADARYSLGRVYYAAFSTNTDEVPTYDNSDGKTPGSLKDTHVLVPQDPMFYVPTKPNAKPPTISQKIQYIGLALDNLTTAVRLNGKDKRSHLTLGCTYEDGLRVLQQPDGAKAALASQARFGVEIIHSKADLDLLAKTWRARAAREYLKAFNLANQEKQEEIHFGSLAEEAGTDYLRIADRDASAVNSVTVLRVRLSVARLARMPRLVTPIIFSRWENETLSDATQSTATINFDLDGNGRTQQYHWLRPDTGILVWDPANTGNITSGRQLFGSVTWWVFWKDGYHALAALDDDHDGRLSGTEMNGIGVWFDRNGNGKCDPGEVTPAKQLGITSISCCATGSDDATLSSDSGIVMADGTSRKTWDWVAESVPANGRSTTN